jgi:hypothetical protein
MDIVAHPTIVQWTHNGWCTTDVLALELKMPWKQLRSDVLVGSAVGWMVGYYACRRQHDDWV